MSDKIKKIEIKCTKCKKLFPSPFFFGDKKSFESATMIGNMGQCSCCGSMTPCNKENMIVTYE